MKKLIFSFLLCAGLSSLGFAQEKTIREYKSPEQRAQIMTDKMAEKLSLSASQKSEIYKINLEQAQERAAMREKAQADRKAFSKDLKSKMTDRDARINKILNADQQKVYSELKMQMKRHKGGHRDGAKAPAPDRQQ